MKIVASAAALAVLLALPTAGEAASKKSKARAAPVPKQTLVQPRAQFGYTARRSRSPNPAWDVYRSNGYAGSDPDPHIRAVLRDDDPYNDP